MECGRIGKRGVFYSVVGRRWSVVSEESDANKIMNEDIDRDEGDRGDKILNAKY